MRTVLLFLVFMGFAAGAWGRSAGDAVEVRIRPDNGSELPFYPVSASAPNRKFYAEAAREGFIRVQNFMAITVTLLALSGPAFGLDEAPVAADKPGKSDGVHSRDEISVTGEVVYIDLEGGFWGIAGDDGKKYDTPNLPKEFQKEGLKVRFAGRVRREQVSFHMWGIIMEVVSIEKTGETMNR